MDQPIPTTQPNPDEINLLEYIYALVKHKWLIIGFTLLGLIGGYIVALVKGPTWVAEAVIAPRETESQKTPSFAVLGALGGIVASQLNLSGNASLEKIDLILDSREFGAKLIDHFGNSYLEFLNDYIKNSVQSEARENVSYLEKQLVTISDPLLREKIQGLIANEIEKEMVVSKEAFKIIDPVYLSKTFKEKSSIRWSLALGCSS